VGPSDGGVAEALPRAAASGTFSCTATRAWPATERQECLRPIGLRISLR
jgi:hypothetical protein